MKKSTYNILVVEDDKGQNKALCKIVEKIDGCKAIPAYDGLEALKIIDDHKRGFGLLNNAIDLIFLDYQMPNMTGEAFIEQLRDSEHKQFHSRYIPVVIVSAYSDDDRISLAKSSKRGMASGYILKPYEADLVMDIVTQIVIQKEGDMLRDVFKNQDTNWYNIFRDKFEKKALADFRSKHPALPDPNSFFDAQELFMRARTAYIRTKADYERMAKEEGMELEENYEDKMRLMRYSVYDKLKRRPGEDL